MLACGDRVEFFRGSKLQLKKNRKANMIKVLLGIVCATALVIAFANAQTSSTTSSTTTTAGGTTETTTTTTETSGTITEFSPGAQIVLSTSSGTPTTYKFSKTVTYVTEDGKVIEPTKIKKNAKVRVHYIKEGNDQLVDKVIVSGSY
jgi:ABC-type transport system substrate-binding protein